MTTGDNNREQFRTEFEFASAPIHKTALANYDGALKFADAAIKSTFALNGGGLIALPAFIALFKIEPKLGGAWIITGGGVFAAGLVFAALTSLFGYLSAMAGAHSMEEQLNAITHRYAVHFKQHVTPVDVPKLEKLAASLGSRSIHLRKCAVAAGIASLIAFIAGATISGSVLICFRP